MALIELWETKFPRVWEFVHCTLCAYCVHIIVQFKLYILVYSSYCTLHTAHCTVSLVGSQLGVCIMVPCTSYSTHCTCSCTCTICPSSWRCAHYTVHCTLYWCLAHCTVHTVPAESPAGTLSLCICAPVHLCTVPLPVPQAHVHHSGTCSTLCCRCLHNMCIQ